MMKYVYSRECFLFDKVQGVDIHLDSNQKYYLKINDYIFNLTIFDFGIIVFNLKVELDDHKSYQEYLAYKEELTNWILNKEGPFVQALKKIDALFENELKKSYFYNGKYVSYVLTSYHTNDYFLGSSIALAKTVENQQQIDNAHNLTIVNYHDKATLFLIWGARVFYSEDYKEKAFFETYLEEEYKAQMLWFLVTSINKKIDAYMLEKERRVANVEELLDYSYNVLYVKSQFDSVKNSRAHRYEIETLNGIITASKLESLYKNLERKTSLLKEKSNIIQNANKERNQKFVNVLLVLISFLSATSTIYGFVSVFTGGDNKEVLYIIIASCVFLFLGVGYLIKNGAFRKKKNKE